MSTLTGTGEEGFQDGDSGVVQFSYCRGVALDNSQGHLLVVDCDTHRIRAVAMNNATTTPAGTGVAGHEEGPRRNRDFLLSERCTCRA